MGRNKELWWPYIRNVIRKYPEYQEELNRIKSSKVTPTYSKGGGVGKSCRKTELTALRTLPQKDQERFDAVDKAFRRTQRMPDGDLRVKFIKLAYTVYNGKTKCRGIGVYAAGDKCFISNSTAARWNKDFVYMVADYLNLRN